VLQTLRAGYAAGSSKPGGPVSITGKGATVPWPNGLRRHSPKVQIQVRFLAGSLARLGKLVKSLGSNPRVSRFESGAAHQRGYSSMAEQPAFNRSTAGSIPRAPTILRSCRPVAGHRPRNPGPMSSFLSGSSSMHPTLLRPTKAEPSIEKRKSLPALRSLVLNADYRPLSTYALSIIAAQAAVSAFRRERFDVVQTWPDAFFRSPSTAI
jgi:hypothetical protein